MSFEYVRRVAFADTDAMGVTHHANYLRYCEESRVAWMRARGISGAHWPGANRVLAVLSYRVWHLAPTTFEDEIRVQLQARRLGLKIHYQYVMWKGELRVAEAETWHAPVNRDLKVIRPGEELVDVLEKEPWIETLLLNS